ncbi:MAG: lytic murein transglycosylase B [Burkholderiales bacterium]
MTRTLRPIETFACAVLAGAIVSFAAHAQDPRDAGAQTYGTRPDVRGFIEEMVDRHKFDRAQLGAQFERTRFQPSIVRAMQPLARGQRSWQVYRSRFVHPNNIRDGAKFWAQHAQALSRAWHEYGVPPEIIVSIIGIETQYGRNMGTWRVMDALTTLAFDYPVRAEFFRSELEHFLLLTRESRMDPFAIRGSYAGAVGIPQFMPGSYRRWAVDFDRDGRRDLLGSPTDAIGSVANFLREHGWRPGEPTILPVTIDGPEHELLLVAGIEPKFRAGELDAYGVRLASALDEDTPLALVELDTTGEASVFYAGLQNFYTITRYNQSSFYAVSVIDLANAIRDAYQVRPNPRTGR